MSLKWIWKRLVVSSLIGLATSLHVERERKFEEKFPSKQSCFSPSFPAPTSSFSVEYPRPLLLLLLPGPCSSRSLTFVSRFCDLPQQQLKWHPTSSPPSWPSSSSPSWSTSRVSFRSDPLILKDLPNVPLVSLKYNLRSRKSNFMLWNFRWPDLNKSRNVLTVDLTLLPSLSVCHLLMPIITAR